MPTTRTHPSLESLAALAEGRLRGEEKMSVVDHVSGCRECYTLFADTASFVAEANQKRTRRTFVYPLSAAAAIALLIIGVIVLMQRDRRDDLSAVSAAAARNHTVRFRLSGGIGPGNATERAGTAPSNEDLLRVYLDLKKKALAHRSPRALHALGVSALLLGKSDEAVTSLQSAAAQSHDARIQNDLAAALAYRWESRATPDDLDAADAAARRALAMDPSRAEAMFNRARILEAEGNAPEAIVIWKRYLAADPNGPWAEIARARLQRLSAPRSEQWPAQRDRLEATTSDVVVRAIVTDFPQESRTLVEEDMLPQWAEAAQNEDRDGAARTLKQAERTGNVLAARGERLAIAVVRHIATAAPAARCHLAAAISTYAEARRSMKRGSYDEATRLLHNAAQQLEREQCAFAVRAHIALSSAAIYEGDYKGALQEAQATRRATNNLADFAAADAQLHWIEGLCLLAEGRPVEGLESYDRAASIFGRLGELENLAAVRGLLAEAHEYEGDVEAAERQRQMAIAALMEAGNSERLPLIFSEAADAALRRGNLDRALALQRKIADRARSSSDPVLAVQTSLSSVEILCAEHDLAAARRQIGVAREQLAAVRDPAVRQRLAADFGVGLLRLDPRSADLSAYDAKIALLRTERNHYAIARLLLEKGERLRSTHRLTEAAATFRAAFDEIDALRSLVADMSLRSSFFETGSRIIDGLVLTLVDEGKAGEALFELQRSTGRSVFDAASLGAPLPPLASIVAAVPAKAAAIQFKVIDNRLLIWVIHDRRIAFAKTAIDHRRSRDEATTDAAALYRVLISPVERELRDAKTWIIASDPVLSDVDFETLRPQEHAPVVIERINVVYAPSLATLSKRSTKPIAALRSAAFFGNPRIDAARFATLPALPAAEDEVRDAARLYPTSRVFIGAAAVPQSLFNASRTVDVVHIAAHAVENSKVPYLSLLLLSADGAGSGVVYADQIARAHIASRVVVLSGCSTAGGAALRTEGVTSLATAFLAGGADAVLATSRPLRDAEASALTLAFHRHLLASLSPAAAFHRAQLECLRSAACQDWKSYRLLIASTAAI